MGGMCSSPNPGVPQQFFQLGVILPFRDYLTIYEDIFGFHNLEAQGSANGI